MTTRSRTPAAALSPPTGAATATSYRHARRFTVAEYYRMAEAGILGPDERVELIEGEIIVMPPIGPGHAWDVALSIPLFSRLAGDRFILQIQNPVHLDDGSEPQPDIMLIRPRAEGYRAAHPTPADVLLVIEVADSSLNFDLQVKARLYGRAGIPETWVKNLPEDCIERFTEPGPDGYARHTVHRRGETLTPTRLPDLELAVDDLLPSSAAPTA